MPSLQELLEQDLGAGSTKTASAKAPAASDDVSIEKLAASLGLFADSEEKVAEFPPKKDDDKDEDDDKDKGEEKEASASMGSLFDTLFPDDIVGGVEKTAEEEKIAEYQEAVGARTFDHFAARFDQRIEKLAYAALSGQASTGQDHQPPNHIPNDKAQRDAGGGKMNTNDTVVTDEIKPENSPAVVGREGAGGNVNATKTAAIRKHFLLSALGQAD